MPPASSLQPPASSLQPPASSLQPPASSLPCASFWQPTIRARSPNFTRCSLRLASKCCSNRGLLRKLLRRRGCRSWRTRSSRRDMPPVRRGFRRSLTIPVWKWMRCEVHPASTRHAMQGPAQATPRICRSYCSNCVMFPWAGAARATAAPSHCFAGISIRRPACVRRAGRDALRCPHAGTGGFGYDPVFELPDRRRRASPSSPLTRRID